MTHMPHPLTVESSAEAMRFVAIHRSTRTSLAIGNPWLNPDEWSACTSAAALLDRLEQVHAAQVGKLEAAVVQGRQAGVAAGHAQALRETAGALTAAWQQAADASRVDEQALRDAVLALSVQLVQHIARDLAPHDVVAALLRRASEDLMPQQAAVVHVHPDVADAVRERLRETSKLDELLELRADPTLDTLDCVFETSAGRIIAGLNTQLERIAQLASRTQRASLGVEVAAAGQP